MKTNGDKSSGKISQVDTRAEAAKALRMLRENSRRMQGIMANAENPEEFAAAAGHVPMFLIAEAICAHLADVAEALRHDTIENPINVRGLEIKLRRLDDRLTQVEHTPAVEGDI